MQTKCNSHAAKANQLLDIKFFILLVLFLPMWLMAQTSWYVNDNDQTGDTYTTAIGNDDNPGTAMNPFATIGKAILSASAGDIICVDAGMYVGNITINKGLDIRGSNYNISPNTGVRVSESLIIPASSDPVNGNVVTITSSGVKFRGFTVDGDIHFWLM